MGKAEPFLEHADALGRGLLDIGRASKASGVSVKMIRHYEAIGLLKNVARTFANYRVYNATDIHTLRFIKRARSLGFSMEDIRALLSLWQDKRRSSAAVKKIAGAHMAVLEQRIAEMQSMLTTLGHLTHHCHGDQRPDCPILDDLAQAACLSHDGRLETAAMNCEHCLGIHPLDCGLDHALCRLWSALARSLRSALASLAQLG